MPSVVGLLEQRELGARRRVDGLREEADRIQAELAVTERAMAHSFDFTASPKLPAAQTPASP